MGPVTVWMSDEVLVLVERGCAFVLVLVLVGRGCVLLRRLCTEA